MLEHDGEGTKVMFVFLLIAYDWSISRILTMKTLEWVGENLSHSQVKNKSEQPLTLCRALQLNLLLAEFRDVHYVNQTKWLCWLLHIFVGKSHCMLMSSSSVIYQSHAMAGEKKSKNWEHDRHSLLAEGWNENQVETLLKSFVIDCTERPLGQM